MFLNLIVSFMLVIMLVILISVAVTLVGLAIREKQAMAIVCAIMLILTFFMTICYFLNI